MYYVPTTLFRTYTAIDGRASRAFWVASPRQSKTADKQVTVAYTDCRVQTCTKNKNSAPTCWAPSKINYPLKSRYYIKFYNIHIHTHINWRSWEVDVCTGGAISWPSDLKSEGLPRKAFSSAPVKQGEHWRSRDTSNACMWNHSKIQGNTKWEPWSSEPATTRYLLAKFSIAKVQSPHPSHLCCAMATLQQRIGRACRHNEG
jgi:hypothetical protein